RTWKPQGDLRPLRIMDAEPPPHPPAPRLSASRTFGGRRPSVGARGDMGFVLIGVVCAVALALGLTSRVKPSAWAERRAQQRGAERAEEVAGELGLGRERDEAIFTTWRLRTADGVRLWMGSPAMAGDKVIDWMKLEAPGQKGFPEGVKVRPPRR